MNKGDTQYIFVGSADGLLRAFRNEEGHDALTPAGVQETRALSFFALGRRREDGSRWVFVSGRESLQVLVYSPEEETFRVIDEVSTAGSGTHLMAQGDNADGPENYTLFLSHYHQHRVSLFRFSERLGFGPEVSIEPGKNAHQCRVRGSHLYIPCLGSHHIAQYRIVWQNEDMLADGSYPQLLPLEPFPRVPGGPRHMTFLPGRERALVLCELESRLELFDIESDGRLTRVAAASTFTHPDQGAHWSSDVAARPDGAFSYAVNRDPPELVTFSMEASGEMRRAGSLELTAPVRSLGMDPDGAHLRVGGEDGLLHTIAISDEVSVRASIGGFGAIRHVEVVADS